MTDQEIKTGITSLTALVFMVVGTTGILLYFHLIETHIKALHEILGLFFVCVALLHLYSHWKPMQRHMRNKQFLLYSILIGIVSIFFIASSESGENPKKKIIIAVLDAPLEVSLPLLKSDRERFESRLKEMGITIKNADTISDIAKQNRRSPFELVNAITE